MIGMIASFLAIAYVKPEQKLDLAYSELPLRDKLAGMLVNRKPEITLTESEVNELLKKALAARPDVRPDVTVTGARFDLQGDQLTADVNVRIKRRIEAAATLRFDLDWKEPYLIAVHTGTFVKQVGIPGSWFHLEPLQANLNDYLPRLAAIRSVAFENAGVKLSFKLR
ncbi:hypothetical protein ACFQI7_20385 [Paenibacillus allorhizosphaerae]|nr:hypothetical protein [Paenibacillus allorhizosphaerae]